MSGAASVILAFSAAYFEFIIRNGKAALWVTAAICFIVTVQLGAGKNRG